MSSRILEKERRREERLRQAQEQAVRDKRSRQRPILAGLLFVSVAIVVAFAAARGGGNHPGDAPASPTSANATFSQHYDGLDQRRDAAHVPTMMDTMKSTVHFHPVIEVFVDRKPVSVPANIGIDPRVDGMQMAGLHTHDTGGTIHVEGAPGATLGQFFTIWGVPFSPIRLGPHRAGGGKTVRLWVNGKPSSAFGALKLADGQRIVVSFGLANAPAPGR